MDAARCDDRTPKKRIKRDPELDLCAFYAAQGWKIEDLDKIASASANLRIFLEVARETYWKTMYDVMSAAIARALGGEGDS